MRRDELFDACLAVALHGKKKQSLVWLGEKEREGGVQTSRRGMGGVPHGETWLPSCCPTRSTGAGEVLGPQYRLEACWAVVVSNHCS